jgi:hypothetical protein
LALKIRNQASDRSDPQPQEAGRAAFGLESLPRKTGWGCPQSIFEIHAGIQTARMGTFFLTKKAVKSIPATCADSETPSPGRFPTADFRRVYCG